MTPPPVGVERRIGQRFAFNLPVSLRDVSSSAEGLGFTQDLSSRGAFLFTDMQLSEGAEIELTLRMPSEITLGDSMPVRCRGRVLRIAKTTDRAVFESKPVGGSSETLSTETRVTETKIGVAVCINGYEYLAETDDFSADGPRRILALHQPHEGKHGEAPESGIPRAAS